MRSAAIKHPVALPLILWLLGAAALLMTLAGALYPADVPQFFITRVSVYLLGLTTMAMLLVMLATLGVSAGLMLRWLGERVDGRQVAAAVGAGLWCWAAHAWIGCALLLAHPPLPLAPADPAAGAASSAYAAAPAFLWMQRLGSAASVAFLAVAAWRLSRIAKPLNAVLSVAFGAGLLAALAVAFNVLGSLGSLGSGGSGP